MFCEVATKFLRAGLVGMVVGGWWQDHGREMVELGTPGC